MKIYIIDQHQIVIDGLVSLLARRKGFEIAGFTNSHFEASHWLERNQVDLIITEIVFENENPAEFIKSIKKLHQNTKILILTGENKIKRITDLFQLGIDGFVEKHNDSKVVVEALTCIKNGKEYVGEELREKIMQSLLNSPNSQKKLSLGDTLDSITNRELEVIQLICDGCNSKEISDKLFISFNTVETHRRHIFQKLNIRNSTGLVRFAIKHNLIEH
ncbi:response regulator transcription factor [Soonwooa sp.]|uniref:response regulator transcription factor n=1 Tax=Soonwooa sp. TaxID=1938592 RepID=UPI0028A5B940|nr:response regulator transcription factor [Soonwooa sp.]